MNNELVNLLEQIKDYKYLCLFGRVPSILIDLTRSEDLQVCLGDKADYIDIGEVVEHLQELATLLKNVQIELDQALTPQDESLVKSGV